MASSLRSGTRMCPQPAVRIRDIIVMAQIDPDRSDRTYVDMDETTLWVQPAAQTRLQPAPLEEGPRRYTFDGNVGGVCHFVIGIQPAARCSVAAVELEAARAKVVLGPDQNANQPRMDGASTARSGVTKKPRHARPAPSVDETESTKRTTPKFHPGVHIPDPQTAVSFGRVDRHRQRQTDKHQPCLQHRGTPSLRKSSWSPRPFVCDGFGRGMTADGNGGSC